MLQDTRFLLVVYFSFGLPPSIEANEGIRLFHEFDMQNEKIWAISREILEATPRWKAGDPIPLDINECLKKIQALKLVEKDENLIQVAIQRVSKQKANTTGLEDHFFFVFSYLKQGTASGTTVVFLSNGSVLSPQISQLKGDQN